MHPKQLSIHDYTYELPETSIAHYPLEQRDASKLLIWKDQQIGEDIYRNIDQYLPSDSLLVFNNTKVVAARILFQKSTGGVIEIFCLEPDPRYADITTAMSQTGEVVWMCLVGGASKWKHGLVLEKKIPSSEGEIILQARYLGRDRDAFAIALSWNKLQMSFAEVLTLAGLVPLPPYIKRTAEISDIERYQTIYAKTEGSVAAPTAGLHFTDQIFSKLDAKNIKRAFVTLHVGAGTFQPVKSDVMEGHEMHVEFIEVSSLAIEQLLLHHSRHVTAVGTTSLRTIESLYWLGVKTIQQPTIEPHQLVLHQWDAYELPGNFSVQESLESLIGWMTRNNMERLITKTQLLIAPGYTIRIPKALVTNFHQPQSTLLLLVAAMVGKQWKQLYQYALEHEFRFLSYGDGCLLFTSTPSAEVTPA